MGRGVEKARVAFAAAENGADKIERKLVRLRRYSSFGRFRRGRYSYRWRRRGRDREKIGLSPVAGRDSTGVPHSGFPFPGVVACGSCMADGTGGIGFTLG